MDKERIQIGKELLVIEETGKEGEVVYSEESQDGMRVQRELYKDEEDRIPDPGARAWAQNTEAAKLKADNAPPDGFVAPGTFVMCKNDKCNCADNIGCGTNWVAPSKNIGRRKMFCCTKCAHKYHARAYQRRNRSPRGYEIAVDNVGRQYQVTRLVPRSVEGADTAYHHHLEKNMCPNASEETLWVCPSHMMKDAYSTKRLCIVYACLVDDMKGMWAKNRHEIYTRQFTTNDGRWLDDEDVFAIHEDPQAGIVRPDRSFPK